MLAPCGPGACVVSGAVFGGAAGDIDGSLCMFHRESGHACAPCMPLSVHTVLYSPRACCMWWFQALSSEERQGILMAVADALVAREADILRRNAEDVKNAEAAGTAPSLLQRLKLKPNRVRLRRPRCALVVAFTVASCHKYCT